MSDRVVLLSTVDDVATCIGAVAAGATVTLPDGRSVVSLDDIPSGHKIALRDMGPGDVVRKYGQPIGVATRAIRQGEHVHTHNLSSGRAGGNK